MADESTKRKSKDSIFVDLFTDVNYVYRLYTELRPEDTDVTVDDINIQTIKSVLVNTLYNDLGFIVKDRLLMLVEVQSVWNPNIALRMMFYLSETYRRYLADSGQSEHSSSRVKLPKPELYVVYSGNKKIDKEISLSNDFFGGDSPVGIKIKVLNEINSTIYGQYIGLCKVFDEQKKIHSRNIECATETLRVCIEEGYLSEYLETHKKEAISMMKELFDEEYLREQYGKAEKKKNLAEGEAIGIVKGEAIGITKGKVNTLEQVIANLRSLGIPEEQIKKATENI